MLRELPGLENLDSAEALATPVPVDCRLLPLLGNGVALVGLASATAAIPAAFRDAFESLRDTPWLLPANRAALDEALATLATRRGEWVATAQRIDAQLRALLVHTDAGPCIPRRHLFRAQRENDAALAAVDAARRAAKEAVGDALQFGDFLTALARAAVLARLHPVHTSACRHALATLEHVDVTQYLALRPVLRKHCEPRPPAMAVGSRGHLDWAAGDEMGAAASAPEPVAIGLHFPEGCARCGYPVAKPIRDALAALCHPDDGPASRSCLPCFYNQHLTHMLATCRLAPQLFAGDPLLLGYYSIADDMFRFGSTLVQ